MGHLFSIRGELQPAASLFSKAVQMDGVVVTVHWKNVAALKSVELVRVNVSAGGIVAASPRRGWLVRRSATQAYMLAFAPFRRHVRRRASCLGLRFVVDDSTKMSHPTS